MNGFFYSWLVGIIKGDIEIDFNRVLPWYLKFVFLLREFLRKKYIF